MKAMLAGGAVGVTLSFFALGASAAPTSKMLVEIGDYSNVVASPDKQFVAVRIERGSVKDNRFGSQWFVQPMGGQTAPVEVGDGGEPLRTVGYSSGEVAQWSSDSQWIYYRALIGGGVQVWRARRDGSGAQAVTNDPANVVAFRLMADGQLIYSVGASRDAIAQAEMEENDAGIRIDKTTPIGQPLFRSGWVDGRLATQRYIGGWMDTAGLLHDTPPTYRFVDLTSLRTREADANEIAAYKRAGAAPEPKFDDRSVAQSYVVSGDRTAYLSGGAQPQLRVATPGGRESICSDMACANVAWFGWRGRQREIIFASTDRARGGANSLYRWNPDTGAIHRLLEGDGAINGGRNFSLNNACALSDENAACVVSSANTPPRLERIDLTSGARRLLSTPNQNIEAATPHRVEMLSWRDAEGRLFTGQYFPAAQQVAGERAPLFITYYACTGYLRGGAGDEWPLAALADAGIASLCINYPRQEKPADESYVLTDYSIAVSGIGAAIDLLERRGIDTHRVGMGGFSFGAEVVLWLTMNTKMLSAISLATPTLSETYYWQRALIGDKFKSGLRTAWGLGAPDETPERWRRLNPAHNLDTIRIPVLMQTAEQEYSSSIDFFVPLAMSNVPAEMYVFPNEPHYKFSPRHKLAIYERNLDWFRFWLQGFVDPDPAKSEQYTRWREMRERWQSSQMASH